VDPVFGQLYWLTGNLLIDRNNRAKAHGTIAEVVNAFKKRKISFWMFPEGTRSRGRGLLPFKTGAFTRLLPLACRLFRCACPIHRIKLISIA
jgi:1-acyl-sn-glycerol-3-phosphate acyltransferase